MRSSARHGMAYHISMGEKLSSHRTFQFIGVKEAIEKKGKKTEKDI